MAHEHASASPRTDLEPDAHRHAETPTDPVRLYATLTFARGAVVSLAIAACAGILMPATRPFLQRGGLEFTMLRPLHTTFASAWIFLGGVAVVHRYLQDHGGPVGAGERWRLRLQVVLWALAGAGVLGSLAVCIS